MRHKLSKSTLKLLTNWYVIISLGGFLYLFFIHPNSIMIQFRLNNNIESLELEKKFLEEEIAKNKALLDTLQSHKAKEAFAREQYYFKKDNEEVFIIEYQDSIK